MANEVRATGNLQVSRDGFTITGNTTQTLSMTGSQYIGNIQSIGTTYEALTIGDLTDIRYLFITNVSTASISVAMHSASSSFSVLRPDDVLLLPPSGSFVTYQLKSDSAGADVQIVAVEA